MSIKYISNSKEYSIEFLNDSNSIIIKCSDYDNINIIPFVYMGKYKFNELKEKNKFLRIYDSIEELSEFFKQIINQKKLTIINELNGIKTIWSYIKGLTEDKIELTLTKINVEKDDIINYLINEIKNLKIENNKINNKFLDMEKRLNLLENKINEEEKQKSSCEGLINKIITNKNEAREFSKFLFQNENIKFKLLYQATRDDDQIKDIVNKIKGYSPTIFLFYTKNGIKCGGYTKALWNCDSKYKNDPSSFLFNFNNKTIFTIKNSNEAIFCDEQRACFGNYGRSDFYIYNNFLKAGVFESKNKSSYYCNNNYDIQGEEVSKINELEIFYC